MFIVDKLSRVPIYEQIIDQIEFMILQDMLNSDDVLPSVRQLSQDISVNPNTLQKAYAELERRGICYTVPGMGRYISSDAKARARINRSTHLGEIRDLADNLAAADIPLQNTVAAVIDAYRTRLAIDPLLENEIIALLEKAECTKGGSNSDKCN